MKVSKLSPNREMNMKKGLHSEPFLQAFLSNKRGTFAHQQ